MEEKRKGNVQEVKEAMAAGVCAVHCLEDAKKKLEDAKYLGIWDILGGGVFSSILKLLLSLQMMNQRYQKDGEEDVVWDALEM